MKKITRILPVVFLALLAAWRWILPSLVEQQINRIAAHAPHPVSAEARALHDTLRVADLHADSLLWQRDFLKRADRGHTDLPRLIEGRVAVQVLPAVTKSPDGQNYERNDADSDRITSLVIAQMWPPRTWDSLYERAAWQAERLDAFAERSKGRLAFVRSRADLERALARNDGGEPTVAALFAIEGAHPLEGELENLDRLHGLGLRIVGLTHFFDNEVAGSLHGLSHAGLTPFGEAVVDRAGALDMIVDVAHASPQSVRDVLARSSRPVMLSHGGFKGVCDSPRNLEDDLMKQIADAGGLIGVGFWDGAACDATPAGVAKQIVYGIELVGVEHVALGSDYDGATEVFFDSSEQAALTHALLEAGLDAESVRAVMGENAIRFLAAQLP